MLHSIRRLISKDEKGFTLIELMIVVVVIGILAAAIVPQFTKSADKAKVATAKSDLSNFKTVLAIVYSEDGGYPGTADACWTKLHEEGYVPGTGVTPPNDPWNNAYEYVYGTNSYTISTGASSAIKVEVSPTTNPTES